MLRTKLAKSYIKRTIRPLYAWTQSTPKSCFLDPNFDRSVPIWPGMVMTKGVGDQVTLIGKGAQGANDVPYGLSALYVGGDGIDEPLDAGINTFGVWVLAPDAEFEILAPAFDASLSWLTADASGEEVLIYPYVSGANQGKLAFGTGTGIGTVPIARLIKANSASKITIGGLR